MENNLQKAVPFFHITSMAKSLEFYEDRLGFLPKIKWEPEGKLEWCYLEREGVAVMLQEYREEFLPDQPLGIGVSVCFLCQDALSLYREFLQKGLSPQEPFVGNGLWVVSLQDPDGYRLDFESPTEVPEETQYHDWLESKNIKFD